LNHRFRQDAIAVFSDFDGTIAHPDTLNHLTEYFAGVEFRREIGGKIFSGELSLRDGIRLEVATIQGSLDEVLQILKRDVEIDMTFIPFASWCQERETPLTVLSGGMQEVIENSTDAWTYMLDRLDDFNERILSQEEIKELPELRGSILDPVNYEDMPAEMKELLEGPVAERARVLGQRTGEMHLALVNAGLFQRPGRAGRGRTAPL
jgi:hypothetical protein